MASLRSVALSLLLLWTQHAYAQEETLESQFEQFMTDFNKQYSSGEREQRFGAFKYNLEHIQKENAQGNPYQLGLTEHADMMPDDFATNFFGLDAETASEEGMWDGLPLLGTDSSSGGALPESVDWRDRGAVGPVLSQGKCGACWTFATTGAIAGAWQIATGTLPALSQQQFMDCATDGGINQGCGGGNMMAAFQYAEGAGICTATSYPYVARQHSSCLASSCDVALPAGSILGYRRVMPYDEFALKEAVAKQPVAVGIYGESRSMMLYTGGVYTNAGCSRKKIDHGVLIVGYGSDDTMDYWLIKNSWGPKWGLDGYVKLRRGAQGVGECGVLIMPSYPVVRAAEVVPTAPTPALSPTLAPAPLSQHVFYGQAPCNLAEEKRAHLSGSRGEFCAPRCEMGMCPSAPAGVFAEAQCIFSSGSSLSFLQQRYCGLVCTVSSECPIGALCVSMGADSAVCLYPDTVQTHRSSNGATTTMTPGETPTASATTLFPDGRDFPISRGERVQNVRAAMFFASVASICMRIW